MLVEPLLPPLGPLLGMSTGTDESVFTDEATTENSPFKHIYLTPNINAHVTDEDDLEEDLLCSIPLLLSLLLEDSVDPEDDDWWLFETAEFEVAEEWACD